MITKDNDDYDDQDDCDIDEGDFDNDDDVGGVEYDGDDVADAKNLLPLSVITLNGQQMFNMNTKYNNNDDSVYDIDDIWVI